MSKNFLNPNPPPFDGVPADVAINSRIYDLSGMVNGSVIVTMTGASGVTGSLVVWVSDQAPQGGSMYPPAPVESIRRDTAATITVTDNGSTRATFDASFRFCGFIWTPDGGTGGKLYLDFNANGYT